MTERTAGGVQERARQIDTSPKKEMTEDPNIINLLCGVGNNEAKALLVAAMGVNPHLTYGYAPYYPGFMDCLNDKLPRKKKIRIDKPKQFFEHSLVPAGIVETVPFPKVLQGEYGHRLTEYGRDIALSFAGHMLDFSLRHEPSLHEFFGPSHHFFSQKSINPDDVSALTRFKIFISLLKNDGPVRTVDIVKQIGASGTETVGQRLKELDRAGIVTYKALNLRDHEAVNKYRIAVSDSHPDKLPKEMEYPNDRILSRHVYDIAYRTKSRASAGWLTRERITYIITALSQYKNLNEDALLKRVDKILSHLEGHSLIEKKGSSDKRSDVKFTGKQRRTLVKLVYLLQEFQKGDEAFIEEGKRKARRIINNPDSVRTLIEKGSRRAKPVEKESAISPAPSTQPLKEIHFRKGEEWRIDSACLTADPDIFFPQGENTGRKAAVELEAKEDVARSYCRRCPVREACLHFALDTNQEAGIWGGLNEGERKIIIDIKANQQKKEPSP